jgi:hypothetical protein
VSAVGLLNMSTGVLHAPSDRHGIGVCGAYMDEGTGSPWMAGPIDALAERAQFWCQRCFVEVPL